MYEDPLSILSDRDAEAAEARSCRRPRCGARPGEPCVVTWPEDAPDFGEPMRFLHLERRDPSHVPEPRDRRHRA